MVQLFALFSGPIRSTQLQTQSTTVGLLITQIALHLVHHFSRFVKVVNMLKRLVKCALWQVKQDVVGDCHEFVESFSKKSQMDGAFGYYCKF